MRPPLFGIPVSEIRASQVWIDRVEANPANYLTPESRLFLQWPKRLDPFMLRGLAMVTVGETIISLDARTPEEKEADDATIRPFLLSEENHEPTPP